MPQYQLACASRKILERLLFSLRRGKRPVRSEDPSPHQEPLSFGYTEDQLVEQPAIGLFAELGWQAVSAKEEIFGPEGTLRRETPEEVVLLCRLRAALERLNPALPPEAIAASIDELTRDRSAMLLEQATRYMMFQISGTPELSEKRSSIAPYLEVYCR